MSSGQKIFLLLVVGYFVAKGTIGLILWAISKSLQKKGIEVHRKRKELKEKTL